MLKSTKSFIKHAVFGPAGSRLRDIKRGLLKGLKFNVDTESKTMRLLALDEREIASITQTLAGKAATAMDIGANDGWYTQYFASIPNIGKVFAFEPDGNCIKGMEANLDANDPAFKAKTIIVPRMVGNKNDDQWISVDSLADQLTAPILLKIDVDGGEMDVLLGAAATLKQSECLLVIETHSPELEKNCMGYLTSLGYQCKIIPPGWYRLFVREGRQSAHNQWFFATRPAMK